MATLSENATRIVNALGDIKQAIIAKGVTPTGKCETFATAISNIPSGGNVYVENITKNTGGGGQKTSIVTGFAPKRIYTYYFTDSTFSTLQTAPIWYDSFVSESECYYITSSGGLRTLALGGTTVRAIYSIGSNGFTINNNTITDYVRIVAVGD